VGEGDAVTTNCSKHCGKLRKVTMSIRNAFIGKPWPTNLNKNVDLEENVVIFT